MAHILIAEKDEPVSKLLRRDLALIGHSCRQAYDGSAALGMLREEHFDLALLDVALPGMDCPAVWGQCAQRVPVMLVGTKSGLSKRRDLLDIGGAGCLVRPFQSIEFRERIDEALRRTCGGEPPMTVGGCRIDFTAHRVTLDGEPVALTPQEYAVLVVLARRQGQALSREKLLELAWGYAYGGDTRTVDVHVQKLRRKLHMERWIQTVYKLGYRLEREEVRSGNL